MKYFKILSSLAVFGLAACYASMRSNAAPGRSYAITRVVIIDVEKGIAVPGQTVIVVDDRIEKIGAHGKVDIPKGAVIINGHGLYLMPGLVDAHVHYLDAPIFGRLMLANGVLLVRDMGMPNEYILKGRSGAGTLFENLGIQQILAVPGSFPRRSVHFPAHQGGTCVYENESFIAPDFRAGRVVSDNGPVGQLAVKSNDRLRTGRL